MLDGISWGQRDRLQAASSGRQSPCWPKWHPMSLQPLSECCIACQAGLQEAILPACQHQVQGLRT